MDSLVQRSKRGRVLRPIIKDQVQQQIAAIIRPMSIRMVMRVEAVQKQSNGVDCGIFAIAFCQYVLQHNRYHYAQKARNASRIPVNFMIEI